MTARKNGWSPSAHSKIIKKSPKTLRVLKGAPYRPLGFRLVASHHSVGGPWAPVRNDRSQKWLVAFGAFQNHQKITKNLKGPQRGSHPATRLSPRRLSSFRRGPLGPR